MEKDGFSHLTKVLDPALIHACAQAFFERHGDSHLETLESQGIRVGHERYMVTVDLTPPFADPVLIANERILGALEPVLGKGFVLNSFACVVAFPGARAQHLHTDHPALYENQGSDLPAYAVSVAVPLVDCSEKIGGTVVWPGSHRETEKPAEDVAPHHIIPVRGDVTLVDYRTWHGGAPHNGNVPRPLLYLVYSRPWFRDAVNFYRQPPLSVAPDDFENWAPEHRRLLGLGSRHPTA